MSTTKTEFKLFNLIDPFGREDYFTGMAQKGWYYDGNFLFWYRFKKGAPKNRVYRMDYDLYRSGKNEEEYLQMFDDFGWRLHSKKQGFYIFWTEDPEAGSDIFSDKEGWYNVRYKMFEQNFYLTLVLFLTVMLPFIYLIETEDLPRIVEIFSYIGTGIFTFILAFNIGGLIGITSRKQKDKR